jgi:hypothetical protein
MVWSYAVFISVLLSNATNLCTMSYDGSVYMNSPSMEKLTVWQITIQSIHTMAEKINNFIFRSIGKKKRLHGVSKMYNKLLTLHSYT